MANHGRFAGTGRHEKPKQKGPASLPGLLHNFAIVEA
jgi:hypothetical protein